MPHDVPPDVGSTGGSASPALDVARTGRAGRCGPGPQGPVEPDTSVEADRPPRASYGTITARPRTVPACSFSYASTASSMPKTSVCTVTAPTRARSSTSRSSLRLPQ